MSNKEIQEQRMKGYFMQATKEILKDEGLKGISVRNIADKAGYSFATLYNYFKDVNDLVFLCAEDFQQECKTFVDEKRSESKDPTEKLKSVIMAYAGFFIEYPGIFDLFFLERMSDFGNKQSTITVIQKSFENISKTDWDLCVEQDVFDEATASFLMQQTYHVLIGMLVMYLNRRTPESYQDMIRAINGISYYF